MADINLVPEVARKEIKKTVSRQQTANKAALIAILVAGLILTAFFLYWLFIVASSKLVSMDTERSEGKVLEQRRKDITHRALVQKIDEASKFLSLVKPYSISFDELMILLNDSKSTLKIAEVGDEGKFKINGTIHNSSDFESLVEALSESESFSDSVLVTLDGVKDKPYAFDIEMKFLKKGLPEATSSAN